MPKIKIERKLRIRRDASTINKHIGILKVGSVLDVEGPLKGLPVPGSDNSWWYKDSTGYYWSGGVKEVSLKDLNTRNSKSLNKKSLIDDSKVGWGIELLNIPKLWNLIGSKGKGINIAILDTGVDYNHPDLPNYISLSNPNFVCKNFLNNTTNVQDSDGHGTHCAGIVCGQGKQILGVAPDSNLIVGKIMERSSGKGAKLDYLIEGIDWAYKNGADIISLSLSTSINSDRLKDVVKMTAEKGVNIICAIGNDGELVNAVYPAIYKESVAVGSINEHKIRDELSNLSKELDLLAPGVDVYSTGINGTYFTTSGTSMSAAFVSGVFGLLRVKNKTVKGLELNKLVIRSSSDYGEIIGFDNESGFGIINPLNALYNLQNI
ncbi:S8 family peptidase [Rufibacter hautae]|uniref:S8 family serine peptidase n=1 Tax=Rufibacter hautae TaxID=2595005 RepID=A0A5B6TEP5_9BACT|nr:S8 family serine peptidase [Rufibacter hautae]KAA3437710.1 S8 family serine peptidase [Rufibacter hautae]